jgi:hypothetical protein
MKVWVVLEDDRGLGPTVAGVFSSYEKALAFCCGPNGSNCWITSDEGDEVQ